MNPFSPDAGGDAPLNRNAYDLSHSNLFTTEFGRIMPIYHQEVIPGDTIKINSVNLDIQGMPTYFPLLSKLNVSVSYYYARNRCVHDEFEDFIFNTKDVECPWLQFNQATANIMLRNGGLMDSFGVPTIVYSGQTFEASVSRYFFYNYVNRPVFSAVNYYLYLTRNLSVGDLVREPNYTVTSYYFDIKQSFAVTKEIYLRASGTNLSVPFVLVFAKKSKDGLRYVNASYGNLIQDTASSGRLKFSFSQFPRGDISQADTVLLFTSNYGNIDSIILDYSYSITQDLDAISPQIYSDNPFVGNNPLIRLNAFLPRHYEMICNYYYRNDKNNPYILNGEVQYNEFIPTHASGPDTNVYDYHYRNWELDMFTSATQSPQFGDAPLVGLTYNPLAESATLTFQGAIGDGEVKDYQVQVGVDTQGNIASIANFDKDIPSANLSRLTEMINYGVSINDLRVTNSFQRFLENTLRRGLRYRNQLRSHFRTSVDYPDIDIPQYIGGFSGPLTSVRNENMTASEFANLGDFNGSLFGNLQLQHPINIHCPEHGFIIGLMTITPVPAYPQSLDMALSKTSPFDFFLPEFGKIGHVPVHYSTVMPLQNGDSQSPDDVFGYQRAWFDYMQRLDEVHGDFRTSLRQFTLARFFAERPELSEDFTTVHPEELNQVFITENIADKYGSNSKFLCRINHGVTALRPIPLIGTPSLE